MCPCDMDMQMCALPQSVVADMLDKGGAGTAQLQVVSLGAGYDTRPWLASLGMQKLRTHWFNVDMPVVSNGQFNFNLV
jgi:O-methyltransferase involved in polyketide biosynthesis